MELSGGVPRHGADTLGGIGGQYSPIIKPAPEFKLPATDIDDRGFDRFGYHTVTGTRYDEDGNDQAGWASDEARERTRPKKAEPTGIPRIVSSGLPTATNEFVTGGNPLGVYVYDSAGTFFVGDRYGRFSQYPNGRAAEEAAVQKIAASLR